MQLRKAHLHAAAFVAAGAAVGALATAASGGGAAPATAAAAPASAAPGATAPIEPTGAPGALAATESAAARAPRRAESPASESVDPRFLEAQLSERFTQWSRGAANPGLRQAPHRDPLSEMIAAVFPTEETVRTVVLAPRVTPPPPPPPDEDDDDDDDDQDDNEGPCTDDEVCPPGGGGGGGGGGGEPPAGVPEIDGDLLGSGLLLLVGGALVLASRRMA